MSKVPSRLQLPASQAMSAEPDLDSRSRSKTPTSPTYSHLLYQTKPHRSASLSSRSVRSSRSAHSSIQSDSTSSTHNTSVKSIVQNVKSSRYADDHYPLITTIHPELIPSSVPKDHAAIWCAKKMAQIHNTIIRALNSSWNHATSIPEDQVDDFLRFNQILFDTLDHHHKVEDTYMFPAYEKLLARPGAMEENVKGHESFAEGLAVFQKYIFVTKPAEFNGTTFRHIIESFAPELIQHLHDEIPTLAALHVLDHAELTKIWKHAEHLATKDADLYSSAPWTLGCQDKSFTIDGEKSTFPDAPWILEAVVRNWHARKHSGVWKFCPSDLNGQRRLIMVS